MAVERTYQIESSDHSCASCTTEIVPGSRYVSAVVFVDERFSRRDFCVGCWARRPVMGEDGGLVLSPPIRPPSGTEPEPEPAGAPAPAREAESSPKPDDAERSEEGRPSEGESVEGESVEGESVEGESVEAESENRTASEHLRLYAFWKTARPAPTEGKQPALRFDPEIILEFFRGLHDDVLEAHRRGEGCAAPRQDAGEDSRSGGPAGGEAGAEAGGEAGGLVVARAASTARPGARQLSFSKKRDLCFVLSLLLVRKKVLLLGRSGLVDGREWLQLTQRDDPEREYWVENPDLSDEELDRVRDDVGELLNMRL